MSVYCRNCRYFRHDVVDDASRNRDVCLKDSIFGRDWLGRKVIKGICYAESKNENNDCKDFKRKWWKFWIKQGVGELVTSSGLEPEGR